MKLQITAHSYHLRYLLDEDRILLSVALSPESELGMPVTRRLLRNLLDALAKLVDERRPAPVIAAAAAANPAMRETVLDFEHGQSVAKAVAEGSMKDERRDKPLAVTPKLVREINIHSKTDGGLALVFDNGDQALTLEVSPDRIHMVIATFVQMAERAGWDLAPAASWMGGKPAPAPANKVLN